MQRRHFMVVSAAAVSATAWAQDKYPSKPIMWICPYAAGGNADSRSRQVAKVMAVSYTHLTLPTTSRV